MLSLLLLRLAQEVGMLRTSGVEILEWLPVGLLLRCCVDELDREIGGQGAIILDVGEDLAGFLRRSTLQDLQQVCKGADGGKVLVRNAPFEGFLK